VGYSYGYGLSLFGKLIIWWKETLEFDDSTCEQ